MMTLKTSGKVKIAWAAWKRTSLMAREPRELFPQRSLLAPFHLGENAGLTVLLHLAVKGLVLPRRHLVAAPAVFVVVTLELLADGSRSSRE
jgi:hypothetical protein